MNAIIEFITGFRIGIIVLVLLAVWIFVLHPNARKKP